MKKILPPVEGISEELVLLMKNKELEDIPVRELENIVKNFKVVNNREFEGLTKKRSIQGDVSGALLKEIMSLQPMENNRKLRQVACLDAYEIMSDWRFTRAVSFRLLKPCKYYASIYFIIDNEHEYIKSVYYAETYPSEIDNSVLVTEHTYDDVDYIVNKLLKFTHR